MNGNGLDTHFFASADDAQSNFASVGDQDLVKHAVFSRNSYQELVASRWLLVAGKTNNQQPVTNYQQLSISD
jgi:hypothetical protein